MRFSSSARLVAAASALPALALVLGLGLGMTPALAQSKATSQLSGLKLSGDKPIQIESDKLEVRQADSVAVFTGNVSVVQGPTVLKAGKMTVYYVKDAGAAAKGTEAAGAAMTGSANIDRLEVANKVYIKSDDQVATGDRGTFDMKTEVLVLSGSKVVLSQGDNVLVGCKLTVQMKSGLAQVDACGGRVMMSITPPKSGAAKP
ncbi:MAG: LPS ABC transporter substrate-binding protein LptA [Mesorhizobium sp.]|uniref:LPS ABC transporter substrate-binding protein LptA n=1 Tax=Mesorhizobium mediterraneum TaxID=43617 RepID=A0AB36R2Z9_9HYPH|nr:MULTISPECIES: LptA/OstA family protein [Mesorhizobium]RUU23710.1 LPS ABC transporter substrate-binding protein LptA [Mesorhizobium sp. M6A.T.Ca.TU.002.02.2.1]AZO66179.1 LPS ABC transporter substrate-binding protein LptA [Mesorhizobium sp. M6A.T.Cr.TU.016.01.1.1]PAP99068.1 LPS ABC transporter substrate-binding protein LptA [Mesorhizobium mediterraneum]RUU25418.1 LPS ABC transporter substrate-binding protein LptA [Mesorhizobium sp. M6A.T.Ce.TU.016.01.1.1]RUU38498.1 LPS ABC transporter substra